MIVHTGERKIVLAFVLAASASSATAQMLEASRAACGDYTTALLGFRHLAEQGNAQAFGLGVMYRRGEGVPKDAAEAAKWYRRASEQGNAFAQVNLGGAYAHGEGIPQNYLRTHARANLAASRLAGPEREHAVELRDGVAGRLSKSELGRAQRMAEEWQAENE